jgi:hypothetical protein
MSRLLAFGLLLAITTSVSCEQPNATSLVLRIEPVTRSAGDIRFRVMLENVGTPCRPLYIDPVISPFVLPARPRTQLVLTIRDARGRALQPPVRRDPPVVLGARPEDLLHLECGMIAGRYIHLSQFGWDRLPPGRYQVSATLSSHMASFAQSKPGYVERLMQLSGSSRGTVMVALADSNAAAKFTLDVPNR